MAKQKPVLIVLAGGTSSRMWPLREKSLLRFGTEPLLVNQLQRYRALGFKRAVVVGNPENQAIITDLIAPLHKTMQVDVVVQKNPIGMGNALLQARPALQDIPQTPVYVTQVHDVVDDKLHKDMLKAFEKDPKATYLAGYEKEEYFPGGYLIVDDKGQITGIVEKPGADNRPSNLVNIVAHIHTNAEQLFERVQAEYDGILANDDHYERAMDTLMKSVTYKVVPYKGPWSALKYPWHTLDIMDYFLDQINGQVIADDAFIAKTASLVGNVYIGPGAKIFPGAAVVGPAYIGAGTIVGNNALVRNSMVLDHCEVGFTTEIARSYVASRCSMHACRVLDSVFAEGVNFSAGCTTANLRIDRGEVRTVVKGHKVNSGRDKFGAVVGEGAFLAVDVMTMPGVKVGQNAQVGPGTHVLKDLADGHRLYVKQEQEVVEDDGTA
jgi:UDP-N-acetylglucosamine diphosphorylase / glucose-1-phosphate thymidylyltransferase / UDP-N-acetylgalactosamine diphosphorylase / glucosamine-1-phosphate N-acetyltransferase / galactosamine-1-phosphate N-acetyltransferase